MKKKPNLGKVEPKTQNSMPNFIKPPSNVKGGGSKNPRSPMNGKPTFTEGKGPGQKIDKKGKKGC
jgi:hypothetical protein